MIVGASLNGGNVLEETARGFQRIARGLGCTPPSLEQTYKRLDRAAFMNSGSSKVRINPRFNGERNAALKTEGGGSIRDITSQESFDVGMIWQVTAIELLRNLKNMIPSTVLKTRERVLCVGGAFETCETLMKAAREVFKPMQVKFVNSSKYLAAIGAIRVGSNILQHSNKTVTLQRSGIIKTSSSSSYKSGIREPSKKNENILMSILPDRDSLDLSPKESFERKSKKRIEMYKKIYRRRGGRGRNNIVNGAPEGVSVEELAGTRHAFLSCQIKNKPETQAPFAGVTSPLKESAWRDQNNDDVDKFGKTSDLYNLDCALEAALLMEKGILHQGKDMDL